MPDFPNGGHETLSSLLIPFSEEISDPMESFIDAYDLSHIARGRLMGEAVVRDTGLTRIMTGLVDVFEMPAEIQPGFADGFAITRKAFLEQAQLVKRELPFLTEHEPSVYFHSICEKASTFDEWFTELNAEFVGTDDIFYYMRESYCSKEEVREFDVEAFILGSVMVYDITRKSLNNADFAAQMPSLEV